MSTVPMFAPDGTLGDIPQERVPDAVKSGFKVGQELTSPDGQAGIIPLDRVHDALAAGFSMKTAPGPSTLNQSRSGYSGKMPPDTRTFDDMTDVATGLAKGAAKNFAQVSAPGIAASILQKTAPKLAAKFPKQITQNTSPVQNLPSQIVATALPMMLGDEAPPGETPPSPTPKPPGGPGMLSRVGKVAASEVKLPFLGTLAKYVDAIKGPEPPPLPTPPVPQTNGVPWGSMIPQPAPSPKLPPGFEPAGPQYQPPAGTVGNPGPGPRPTPEPTAQPAPAPKLDDLLRNAVGNQPIKPGVKIGEQYKPADLAEGHTPVESSAVKSFKYDAGAKEFHVASKNGDAYVYGEVTPDQAQVFKDAESKGQAWKAIRDSSPLVAKIPKGGARIAVKPTVPAAEPAPTQDNNLIQMLKKSVTQAKGQGMAAD